MLRLLLSATVLVSASALAVAPTPSADKSARVAEQKPKRVCTDIEVPGSNMKRRVCSKPKAKDKVEADQNVPQQAASYAN